MTLGRQGELLAQLRELLLPSPTSTTAPVKVESGGPLGTGPPASCDGRRRRRGSKRCRDDKTNNGEQHEDPAAQKTCCVRRKKQQKSTSLVTSVPDFDGYQWRKYGQKQIEGAMYARSYYRCTRSAEQGCPAKRTVQRNDDDDVGGAAAPKYTVVYMEGHTCTATDSLEEPVILETTTAVVDPATNSTDKIPQDDDDDTTNSIAPTTSAGSCSTTTTATGTESPAISDITWSSSSSSDYVDDYCGLFDVHDSWAPAPASASLQEMEDFTGPIRSPVHHIAAPDGYWTIDQLLLQLVNEPICHF